METHIVRTDENGDAFNRFGQRVIQCKYGCGCGRRTTKENTHHAMKHKRGRWGRHA
jgi:hypothetical protein